MEEEIKGNQTPNGPAPDDLEKITKERDEYLNNWKRAAADAANYKKGEVERAGLLVKYAKEDSFYSILPIIDHIYMAWEQLPQDLKEGKGKDNKANEWTKGFMQITGQVKDFLKKQGIEEIVCEGQPFNAETMEIVSEAEGGPSGTVTKELQKGYIMDGKVLRPAKVSVYK